MSTNDFDLHKLGWKAFEDLSACILKEVLGQTFQTFADGADGGRDGAFTGTWTTQQGESFVGSFTAQCKHTSDPSNTLSASLVSDELIKVEDLVAANLADNYLLLTNYKCPAKTVAEIEDLFRQKGVKNCTILGREWISNTIRESARLRRLVPRVYGLGDLTQIVHQQAYDQAKEILISLESDLAKFVTTQAYKKCADALSQFGFVILLGEPASGKSTIAQLMALSAADEWGLSSVVITEPEEIRNRWTPETPQQFFWIDDAFGATQYDASKTQEWNQHFRHLFTAIRQGARAVLTSRDYIFNRAQQELKLSAFPLLTDSRVTIRVEELSLEEKKMMIYNHLKLGNQPKSFRSSIKKYLDGAANVSRFLPESARRLGDIRFTGALPLDETSVIHFFEHPQAVLEEIIQNLIPAEKAAIALVFINGGLLASPFDENEANVSTIELLQSTIAEVKHSLPHLDGSLLKKAQRENGEVWQFRHPTVRDAFANFIGVNSELIDIYLSGVPSEKLISEVTCGNLGIQGAKIIIPASRFSRVIELVKPLSPYKKDSFLANRCNDQFLQDYFSVEGAIEELINKIRWTSSADFSLKILKKLYALGALDEGLRQQAVEKIQEITLGSYSIGFSQEYVVGALLTPNDREMIISSICEELVPSLEDVVSDLEWNWSEEDPDTYFDDLLKILDLLDERYFEDEDVISNIDLGRGYIEESINTLKTKLSEAISYPAMSTGSDEQQTQSQGAVRSIFDDVDE